MDLCDDEGVPKSLYEAPEGAYGTDFFEHRHMYYIVMLERNDNYVYMNPNCNMKLIYEYLRVVADIPEDFEIDLCSEDGHLLGIYDAECSKNGLQYLQPRANYYIFIFDYREDKPDLYDPRPLMDYTNQDFSYVFGLIKKNFGIPRDEYIREDDAALIFEHMLKAYEEEPSPNMVDEVSKTSRGSIAVVPSTKRGSRKSVKSEGTSRVLQVWREEKRLKMAAAMSAAEEAEEVYMSRRRSRKSILNFLGLDIKNSIGSVGIEEEVEDEHFTHTGHKKHPSTTKKTKKADKKKKHGKDADHAFSKQDDPLRKAAPPISTILDQSGASMISNSDPHVPLSSLNDSNMSVTIRQFFRSHSSSITELPKPPAGEKQKEKNRVAHKMESNLHAVSKKRTNKTK